MPITKKMIFGSMGVAGLVAVASIADLAIKTPFGGYSTAMDIMFLVAAGIILYLGYDTYREMN